MLSARSRGGACFAVRPGLVRAMAELELIESLVSEEDEEAATPRALSRIERLRPTPPPFSA